MAENTGVYLSRRLRCPLTLTGAGALMVNLCCAFILARVRDHHGSLTKAAFSFRRGTTCWPTSRSSPLGGGDRLPLAIGVGQT